jgi:hypothetical protein
MCWIAFAYRRIEARHPLGEYVDGFGGFCACIARPRQDRHEVAHDFRTRLQWAYGRDQYDMRPPPRTTTYDRRSSTIVLNGSQQTVASALPSCNKVASGRAGIADIDDFNVFVFHVRRARTIFRYSSEVAL